MRDISASHTGFARAVDGLLLLQLLFKPLPLTGSEPGRFAGPIGEKEKRKSSQHNGRDSLEHEEPPPSLHSEPLVAENPAGDGRPDHEGQGNRCHEVAGGLGAVFMNEPVAQIDDDAREEASLGRAQDEARQIKLVWGMDQGGQRGQRPPSDHGHRNHAARAPALDQEATGDLQSHIAKEENARSQAEDAVAESQIARHAERGIGQVGAVKIIGDVEKEEKWQQAHSDPATGDAGNVERERRDHAGRGYGHCVFLRRSQSGRVEYIRESGPFVSCRPTVARVIMSGQMMKRDSSTRAAGEMTSSKKSQLLRTKGGTGEAPGLKSVCDNRVQSHFRA